MNAILGFSQILKEQLKDEKYQRYLNAIFSSGNILINLINDILDLSKIEAGRLLLEYRPVSPRDIFNEIASIFRDEIEEKGLELKVEIDPDIPEALLLDEIRLRQILFNLVGNAVKFTDNGFIKISLNKHAVGGEGSRIDLYFSVIDTGIGIPGDQQDEMFEIFTQQKGQSAKKYGGSGLGLSICKRLVSMMGGDIWMESEEGVGTAFYVVLKNLSTATSIPSGQESPSRTEYVRFNGGKVLIADDIKNNRDLLNEYFTPLGLEIIEAENGEIAVEKARSEKPGFILMDIKMPVMDGYEAARILKSDPETGSVPVFACTASVFLCDTAEFREAGFDGYMLKPLSMISVIEILKKYFKYTVDAEAGPNGKKNDFKEGLSYGGSPEELKNLLDRLEGDNLDRWKKISATYIIKEIKFFAEDIIRLGDEFNAGFLKDWGAVVSINASHFDMENLVNSFNKYPLLLNEVKKLHENF